MKNIILLGIICFSFAFAKAQSKKTWTLQECVQYALDNNITVKLSELDVENVALEEIDALGNFMPTIRGSANYSENSGANVDPLSNTLINQTFISVSPGISSGIRLFDGLANLKQMQRAKLRKVLSDLQLEQAENDITLLVANNYLDILLAKENLKTLENQHEVTGKQIEQTTSLVDAGSLPRGDLLEIKATYANEEQQIVAAKNNVQLAKISLAQSLNISEYETFEVITPEVDVFETGIIEKGISDIAQKAYDSRPELKVADQNIEIAKKDLQLARAARWPTLDVFFNYNTRYSDLEFDFDRMTDQFWQFDGYSLGLSLNVPILNGLQITNNIQRSKINLENQRLQKELAFQNLEATIYQAFTQAKASKAQYEASLEVVAARELAFQYAQDRYDVGLMNAFDFNQSQGQLLNAKVNLNQTKYDYLFRIKVLEIYYGIDPQELKL